MKAEETTMAIQRMCTDCTAGMIQDTFWITRLMGVCPSHSANACRVIASRLPDFSPLYYGARRRDPQGD